VFEPQESRKCKAELDSSAEVLPENSSIEGFG
jgi:hypothetical protein